MPEPLPQQLSEWMKWAERLNTADFFYANDYQVAARKMSDEEVAAMAVVYMHAEANNELAHVKNWIVANRGLPISREEKAIRNLLQLWHYLSRNGYIPFRGGPALQLGDGYDAAPDWFKLPSELRFLADFAVKYGKFSYSFSEEGREYIVKTTTVEEQNELKALAERVRALGYEKIKAWRSGLSAIDHIEVHLVLNLIAVMDALDLPYYTPKS